MTIYDLDNRMGGQIIGNSSIPVAALQVKTACTTTPALIVGRTANGSLTLAAMKFTGTSVASGAIMEFAGGFISCTSILMSTGTGDYVLPVSIGAGNIRYIPLIKAADIVGGAAF